MEEIKNKNKGKDKPKKHSADFGLRILAVVFAIIIWFVLSITQYPTINKTITGVHVSFPIEGSAAEERGLSVLNTDNLKDLTVDVEIKGMNYEIGGYTTGDLIASVNLDDVTKAGKYTLDIDVKSSHSTDKCTIVSVTPNQVEVNFDRITSKTVPVTAEASLISAEEGYTLKETNIEPSKVTVEGAEKDLENLSKVVVQVAKSAKIKSDTSISSDKFTFYDADDNVLDSSKFTIKETDKFNVKFTVFKKKTANLKVDITGCPENFDISSLPIKLSEERISIITPNLEEEDTTTITVGSIPLSNINLRKKFEFVIPLASGEISQSGVTNVKVSFNKSGYTSKEFTIDSDRIQLKNTPHGRKATMETQKLTNVTIFGPEKVIASLTDKDIYAEVDLSDVVDTGSYLREATVYVKGYDNVWCYGKNEVQFIVED